MFRVALVGPEIEENLGLRYLAASLEAAGFPTEIVAFNGSSGFAAVLAGLLEGPEPPALIALSLAFQWRALDFLSLAVALRERGFAGHLTAGGHFGTFACREVLTEFPELDSVCRHEAEETLVELARALRDGEPLEVIGGLALRDERGAVALTPLRRPPELATLAWPDRRGGASRCLGHPVAAMVGSRGCYAHCAFCCIAAWHEQTLPGKRYRLRPVEDVADEMAWLHRERGAEIFIFHDDNFFLPAPARSLERIERLADAIERRGVGRIATVVKARPNDVTPEVFGAARERLGLVRVFLGIENDSQQGLVTLRRRVDQGQNHAAMSLMREIDLYVCFNLLLFDPDTTPESLETNFAFMRAHPESPFNFGRVELYAGTPLLERMQAEERCAGDWLGWDYRIADPMVQRLFELAMRLFYPRNFAAGALANRLMGTRFDAEICRHFHPGLFEPGWLAEAKALSRELSLDSVDVLERLLAYVRAQGPQAPAGPVVEDLGARLRATEGRLLARAEALEETVQRAVGVRCQHSLPHAQGAPLRRDPSIPLGLGPGARLSTEESP